MSSDGTAGDPNLGTALRWTVAGLVVVGLHLGIGAALVGRSMLPPPPDAAQAGIPIDLEPMTVPQDETAPAPAPPPGQPQAELPPAVQPPTEQAAADPPPPEPAPAEPAVTPEPPPTPAAIEPPAAPPPPAPEPPPPEVKPPVEPPPMEAPAPVPVPPVPDLPPARTTDDATLAGPMPVSKPIAKKKPKPVKPAPKPVDRQAEAAARRDAEAREAARDERRDAARQAARQRAGERRAEAASAPAQGAEPQQRAAASAGEVASWRGQLMAHLNQFKRSPADGGTGTARVSFSVNVNGGLSGVRLAGSSGDAALDAAAVAMIARANPVPPPPSGLGSHLSLSIPVHFSGE